jgi:hypothetical protein
VPAFPITKPAPGVRADDPPQLGRVRPDAAGQLRARAAAPALRVRRRREPVLECALFPPACSPWAPADVLAASADTYLSAVNAANASGEMDELRVRAPEGLDIV